MKKRKTPSLDDMRDKLSRISGAEVRIKGSDGVKLRGIVTSTGMNTDQIDDGVGGKMAGRTDIKLTIVVQP